MERFVGGRKVLGSSEKGYHSPRLLWSRWRVAGEGLRPPRHAESTSACPGAAPILPPLRPFPPADGGRARMWGTQESSGPTSPFGSNKIRAEIAHHLLFPSPFCVKTPPSLPLPTAERTGPAPRGSNCSSAPSQPLGRSRRSRGIDFFFFFFIFCPRSTQKGLFLNSAFL